MIFDSRPSTDDLRMMALTFFMANCNAFTESREIVSADYEIELLNQLSQLAKTPTSFLARDRQKKLMIRDAAQHALEVVKYALANRDHCSVRAAIKRGINETHKIVYGEQIFESMEDSLNFAITLIGNPPNTLNGEEQEELKSCINEFIDQVTSKGLLKK